MSSSSAAQSSSQSTPPTSSRLSPHPKSKLTDRARFWVLFYLSRAQGKLDVDPGKISDKVYKLMCLMMKNDAQRHHNTQPPSLKSVRLLWSSVSKFGDLASPKIGGRKRAPYTFEAEYHLKTTDLPLRAICDEMEKVRPPNVSISKSVIGRLAQSLKMHAYKDPIVQRLKPNDIVRRLEFARAMQHRLDGIKDIDLNNILFTDECMIGTSNNRNRQNDRHWSIKGEFEPMNYAVEKVHQGKKVHTFIGIHGIAGVLGPYFIDEIDDWADERETLTSSRYMCLLDDEVLPELRKRLTPEQYNSCWFQQDGAAPHTAGATLEWLDEQFGSRIISLNRDLIWPPHSPDMSPLDYWFWSYLKFLLKPLEPSEDLDELKLQICLASESITLDDCRKGISDFKPRVLALLEANGCHFEPTFKQFKNRGNPSGNICPTCEQVHACQCLNCDLICFNNTLRELNLNMEPMET